jgi:hypothetical protein
MRSTESIGRYRLASYAFDENGAISRTPEPVLPNLLIRRAVVPRTRGSRRWEFYDHDALWRVAFEDLLRSVSSQNLDRVTFEGLADLALVNVELILILRAFLCEDNVSRHGVRSCGGVKVRTMMP